MTSPRFGHQLRVVTKTFDDVEFVSWRICGVDAISSNHEPSGVWATLSATLSLRRTSCGGDIYSSLLHPFGRNFSGDTLWTFTMDTKISFGRCLSCVELTIVRNGQCKHGRPYAILG